MAEQTTNETEVKAGIDLGRVRAALGPVLAAHGVSLVDVEWVTEHASWTLRITIDRPYDGPPEGMPPGPFGVTLEDCVEVSRDASTVLDVEDMIAAHYHLEVSSPGLDRPLRTSADFARFRGKTVKVKLRRPAVDGQRVLRGPLVEATEDKVAVLVDGKRLEAPLEDVAEAHLVFELTPQPKTKKSARASTTARGKRDGGKAPATSKRQ